MPPQRGRSASPSRAAGGRGRSMDRGPGAARSNSQGPGRPRSQSRGRPDNAPPGELKKGKRPPPRGGPNGDPNRPKKKVPRKVRKAGGKARKVGKKGYKGVKKGAVKGVRKFQKTRVGKRIAPREKCGTAKVCSYLLAILLLLASCVGLIVATGNADVLTEALNDFVPDFDLKNLKDPFSGTDTTNAVRWKVADPKAGLAIEIQNALDDKWGTVFQLAFADWEYGQPDSLSLTEVKIDYETECSPVAGKIKVCNADYSVTEWRGIAECLVGNDNSYAHCVCKMNDYFLGNAESDLKQYTMCHEMGHGFGLPHTDEDFNNADLGNCLDYTENYGFNKHPDEGNYETLAGWYGLVSGRRRSLRGGDEEVVSAQPPIVPDIPESVEIRRKEASAKLALSNYRSLKTDDGWRMLHRKRHGEQHELDLGDGFKLSVHMLMA